MQHLDTKYLQTLVENSKPLAKEILKASVDLTVALSGNGYSSEGHMLAALSNAANTLTAIALHHLNEGGKIV